jgi:hypothetical protein
MDESSNPREERGRRTLSGMKNGIPGFFHLEESGGFVLARRQLVRRRFWSSPSVWSHLN